MIKTYLTLYILFKLCISLFLYNDWYFDFNNSYFYSNDNITYYVKQELIYATSSYEVSKNVIFERKQNGYLDNSNTLYIISLTTPSLITIEYYLLKKIAL